MEIWCAECNSKYKFSNGGLRLRCNLAENALPEDIVTMTVDDYDSFLVKRRKLMAAIIEKYYKKL